MACRPYPYRSSAGSGPITSYRGRDAALHVPLKTRSNGPSACGSSAQSFLISMPMPSMRSVPSGSIRRTPHRVTRSQT